MTTDVELAHLAMPIANEANKQLEGEVATRRKEIDRLEVQVEQNRDRVQIIKDHLRNVRQELQLTQVYRSIFTHVQIITSNLQGAV